MFWDGERWLPDEPAKPAPARRSWIASSIAAMVVGLLAAGVLLPLGSGDVAAMSGRVLMERWSEQGTTQTVQETSSRITYRGTWYTARHAGYLGGKVRSTDKAGAKAVLRFNGSAISWIGSVGPTRGKAKVYIDGKLRGHGQHVGEIVPPDPGALPALVEGRRKSQDLDRGEGHGRSPDGRPRRVRRPSGRSDGCSGRPRSRQALARSPPGRLTPGRRPADSPVPTHRPDGGPNRRSRPDGGPNRRSRPDGGPNRRADTCSHDGGPNRRADTCSHARRPQPSRPAPTAAPTVAPTPAPTTAPRPSPPPRRRPHRRSRPDGGPNRRADTCSHDRARPDRGARDERPGDLDRRPCWTGWPTTASPTSWSPTGRTG